MFNLSSGISSSVWEQGAAQRRWEDLIEEMSDDTAGKDWVSPPPRFLGLRR